MIGKMIRLTPDQMAYQDRGKMKWQGLLLSDHSEALNKIKSDSKESDILPKKKLSMIEVSETLALAYHTKQPVCFQTNILTQDLLSQKFTGTVLGNQDSTIYFSLKDKRLIKIPLENIWSIVQLNPLL